MKSLATAVALVLALSAGALLAGHLLDGCRHIRRIGSSFVTDAPLDEAATLCRTFASELPGGEAIEPPPPDLSIGHPDGVIEVTRPDAAPLRLTWEREGTEVELGLFTEGSTRELDVPIARLRATFEAAGHPLRPAGD